MGLFDMFSSQSSATDQRIGATDQAQVISKEGQIANPGSVNVGKNAKVNTGLDVQGGIKGNLIIGDTAEMAGLSANLSKLFSDTVAGLTEKQNLTIQDLSKQQNDALEKALSQQSAVQQAAMQQVSTLSEARQTGPEIKLLMWVGLGALALVGFTIFLRR